MMKRKAPGALVSVVVIGVTSSSQTKLGMVAKTALETAPLEALEPIYFCNSADQMEETIAVMQVGLAIFDSAKLSTFDTCSAGARFVMDLTSPPSTEASTFVREGCVSTFLLAGQLPEHVLVDGTALVKVEVVPVNIELGAAAITTLMGKLRQNKVAGQASAAALHSQSKIIEAWIEVLEAQLLAIKAAAEAAARAASSECDDPAAAARTATGRLRLLKKKVGTEMNKAKMLMNELAAIIAFQSNDSSTQAAFLTGMSSKFAAKAMARANHGSGGAAAALPSSAENMAALMANVKKVATLLPVALRKDALLKLARFTTQQLEQLDKTVSEASTSTSSTTSVCRCTGKDLAKMLVAVSAAANGGDAASASFAESPPTPQLETFLDTVLPAALDAVEPTDASWLSLLTHRQQLCEWVEMFGVDADPAAATAAVADITTEYKALMFVGMHALPIEVERCAATQMAPYKMKVKRVWPSVIDTCSLLYSLKMNGTVRAPEGGELKDMLALIDPQLPHASRIVCRSSLMDSLTSITLCRDLRMFQGNEQRMALHAHALMAIVAGKGQMNAAEVKQALRIIYSARKHLVGTFAAEKYTELLKRLQNWESLTEADGVDHTAQLVLAATVLDKAALGMSTSLDKHALFNLCNEVLSRAARAELRASTDGSADVMRRAAHNKVVALLSIDAESCPQPTAVEEAEPDIASIAEACESVRPGFKLTKQSETRTFCGTGNFCLRDNF